MRNTGVAYSSERKPGTWTIIVPGFLRALQEGDEIT